MAIKATSNKINSKQKQKQEEYERQQEELVIKREEEYYKQVQRIQASMELDQDILETVKEQMAKNQGTIFTI